MYFFVQNRLLQGWVVEIRDKWPQLLFTATNIFFGGKYVLIQLHRKIIHQKYIHKKLIEIVTISIFYLKKANNETDMKICYFSCFGQYCFGPRLWQLCRPKQLLMLALEVLRQVRTKSIWFQGKGWLS